MLRWENGEDIELLLEEYYNRGMQNQKEEIEEFAQFLGIPLDARDQFVANVIEAANAAQRKVRRARRVANDLRETPSGTAATPRLEDAATETTARAQTKPAASVFAEAAAKSFRRKTRHVFTEKELRDPETLNRARDILADIQATRRGGEKISDAQRQAGRWADALSEGSGN